MERYIVDLVIKNVKTDEEFGLHMQGCSGRTKASAINNIRKDINRSLLETVHRLEITKEDVEE